jgi:lipopolysaccharide transport system ATP-binding protein
VRLITGAVTGNFSPTSGSIEANGSVQALMHAGTGFQPELSGLENARAALVYNGLWGKHLEHALSDVVSFAELGDFIHRPLSTYSLGMGTRLQFAVASAVAPEILIVDEVLGAGDAYFAMKSAARMRQLASRCTLLLVSHQMQQIVQLCDRAIWIRQGSIVLDGPAGEVVNAYEAAMEQAAHAGKMSEAETSELTDTLDDGRRVFRWPSRRGVKFRRIAITADGEQRDVVQARQKVAIELELGIEDTAKFGCTYLITVWTRDYHRLARIESERDEFHGRCGERRTVRVDLGEMLIAPGDYLLTFAIYDRLNFATTDAGAECRFDLLYRSIGLSVTGGGDKGSPAFSYPSDCARLSWN